MLVPGQQVGNYIIEAEVGVGGMAMVFKVRHTVLESVHAMKVLLPHLLRVDGVLDRFVEEAKIQAQFRHPSLVRVTDIISEPGIAGLIMDFLDGDTLDDRIIGGPIPIEEALRWCHQICAALAYIHTRGVVHRDIKPGNLLVEQVMGQGSQVRVMDFGIAKVHLKHRTRTSVSMGTPAYMSPEQVTGASRVDARSDLFSLGCVLYELLTGQCAFNGDTDYAVQQAILEGVYVPIRNLRPEVSPHIEAIVSKALSTTAAERFSTARTMGRQIAVAPEAAGLITI